MKIIHVSGAKGWGGNEQQMIDLISELQSRKIQNLVYGLANSDVQRECARKNIQFIAAKASKLNSFANYKDLKNIVIRQQASLLHLHTSDSLTLYVLSDLLYKIPAKAIFSKKGMGSSSSFLSKAKYNYKKLSAIICVSRRVQQDFSPMLSSAAKSKTIVIHDAVSAAIKDRKTTFDIRAEFNIGSQYIVGNIANHTNAKDLFTYLETVNYYVNTLGKKDAMFVQIGEFSRQTPLLKETASKLGIQDFIIFAGKIPDAYLLNSQFDVFMMTSQREGGPTSVLEAMLLGTPVVSTNVGVVPDAITDGSNGFIADVKDYQALSEKLDVLLHDESLRNQFSQKSSEYILRNFEAAEIASQIYACYNKVLNEA